jgi:16S rRNA pseudouridine516 synthase
LRRGEILVVGALMNSFSSLEGFNYHTSQGLRLAQTHFRMAHTCVTVAQFIAKKTGLGKRHAKAVLGRGEVCLNQTAITDGSQELGKFDQLTVSGEILQSHVPRYLLIHKPAGILSATSDPTHRTVIDLIREPWARDLHLAGRLDRSTTGLVILTNDSVFSESLMRPGNRIPKTYHVETDDIITAEAIEAFRKGMFFAKEKISTQEAIVIPLSETSCRLTIYEGKHHQIKRMFLRFGIRVTKLHRDSIGPYVLPEDLAPGHYRMIDPHIPESCV